MCGDAVGQGPSGSAHIPEEVAFRTKPRIAAELIRSLAVLGTVTLDWVVADSEYGRAGHLLDELEELEQRYVREVPVTTAVRTTEPACRRTGVEVLHLERRRCDAAVDAGRRRVHPLPGGGVL